MKLRRFVENSEVDNTPISNDEIKKIFYSLTDEGLATLNIRDIFITADGFATQVTPYVKNSNTTKGRLITLNFSEKPKGINLNKFGHSYCFTDLETLESALHDIKRFYVLTGEEMNYQIKSGFGGLQLMFVTKDGKIDKENIFVKEIDGFLQELKRILKAAKYHRVVQKGNWLEVRLPIRDNNRIGDPADLMRRVINGAYDNEFNLSPYKQAILDWRNSVVEKGFAIEIKVQVN